MNDKKYKIKLLFDVPGWAYYWQCVAMKKYAPKDFDVTIACEYNDIREKNYDLILQCAFSYAGQLKKCLLAAKQKTLVVSTYSVGWGYANTWMDGCIRDSDWVIVNNFDMWEKYGKHPKTITISNGVDLDVFNIRNPIETRKSRVLWIGSIGHRKVKNYESILLPLTKQCQSEKIATDFKLVDSYGKNRMNQDQMCSWYNSGSIYVCASSSEGTPNPALEAAACGCTVVSSRVGNMPEIIVNGKNGYLCDTTIDSLMQGIRSAASKNKELSINMQDSIKTWGWKERSDQYFDFFRKVIDENRD